MLEVVNQTLIKKDPSSDIKLTAASKTVDAVETGLFSHHTVVIHSHHSEYALDAALPESVAIFFIVTGRLNPKRFDLQGNLRDYTWRCRYPGKSATIRFTNCIIEACKTILRRDPYPHDNLYETTVGEILQHGFVSLYTPTYRNPHHVQVVHEAQLEDPRRPSIPESSREQLIRSLRRVSSR